MDTTTVYDEIVDFLATAPSIEAIITFKVSEVTREHVADLIRREKSSGITTEEAHALDHYLKIEHIMRLVKARARKQLRIKS
jgi:hypothetical protein